MIIARALLISLFTAGLGLAADPFIGIWKFNPDKSKFDKAPSPTFAILKWETIAKDHYRVTRFTSDGKPALRNDGKPVPPTDFILDGKEHQVADYARSMTRIDSARLKSIEKGKGTELSEFSVSTDGRTFKLIRKGTTVNGLRPLDEVWVYDKQ
jgi:hypothetical protein